MYCVYLHLTLDESRPFYLGKGKGRRPFSRHNRNRHWCKIVAKHGFKVKLLAENLTEEAAFELEQRLILQYKAEGHTLANYVDGGRGVPGLIFSDESIARMSTSLKERNKNPTKSMLAARAKLSKAKKRAWENPSKAMLNGAKRGGEKRRGRNKTNHAGIAAMAIKIKEKVQGQNNPNHKWIWCTPFGEFFSSYEAARVLNIGRKTVERRCKNGVFGWMRKEKNHG